MSTGKVNPVKIKLLQLLNLFWDTPHLPDYFWLNKIERSTSTNPFFSYPKNRKLDDGMVILHKMLFLNHVSCCALTEDYVFRSAKIIIALSKNKKIITALSKNNDAVEKQSQTFLWTFYIYTSCGPWPRHWRIGLWS